jgi:sugar O-acyltransferase (sialic acid O-acetyltransferase NeuD family)
MSAPGIDKVVMVGGGGHAMSCLDAAVPRRLEFVGYVSPEPDDRLPLKYLGGDDVLEELRGSDVTSVFVALGDNGLRRTLCGRVTELGFELATLVADTARVSPYATVLPGAAVLHGALVGPRAEIGTGAVINTAASVDHDCVIEEFAHIAPGTHLAGGVRIGAGAFAGVGASVIPDLRIGPWAIVGAGAVVITHVPPRETVVGAPARTRRRS